MGENKTIEFEVKEVFPYPDPTVRTIRRFLIIEYEVTKKEINRYEVRKSVSFLALGELIGYMTE